MKTWKDLIKPTGTFESSSFYIGNSNKYWFMDITPIMNEFDGEIKLEYSISHDDLLWSEWKVLYASNGFILKSIVEDNTFFKFKVTMNMSNTYKSPTFKSMNISFRELYKINNVGDFVDKPKIWIRKTVVDGEISLYNLSTDDVMKFATMKIGEEIFVDSSEEDIISSLPLTYRFDDHNDVFLSLVVGNNYIYGTGEFELDIKYQMEMIP